MKLLCSYDHCKHLTTHTHIALFPVQDCLENISGTKIVKRLIRTPKMAPSLAIATNYYRSYNTAQYCLNNFLTSW